MSMKIIACQENDVLIIRPEGKIAPGTGDQELTQAVRASLDQGTRKILINFAKVTTMDSSGLGELVGCFTTVRKAQGELSFCTLNSRIFDLMRMTNLHTVFDLKDTEAEALEAFGGAVR